MEQKYIEIAKKRIEKIKVEDTDLHNLVLEVKPPRVSTKQLIESGYLKNGEKLYNKKDDFVGNLTSIGYVDDSEDVLSIHKMSAKHLNLSNNNGWDYFYFKKNKDLKPINDLRYEYTEQNNG